MGRKKRATATAPDSPPLTRARSSNQQRGGAASTAAAATAAVGPAAADVTYYTLVKSPDGDSKADIQVISKKRLKVADGDTHRKLTKRLARAMANQRGENDDSSSSKNRRIVVVTNINVFLYATCFFIQVNSLPYLSKHLGADPATFGHLQTAFAVAQLFGGPLYGRVGDLLGERLALFVAFASATLSYLLMGLSYNLPILFLSRLPSVFMHVMQGSQMVVTSMTDESQRATALSRLGFSYGIGMVVGPTLGGQVGKYFGEQSAALVAAGGSLLSLVLVFLFIPGDIKAETKKTHGSKKEASALLNVGEIAKLLFLPGTAIILLVKLACGVPIGVLQSMFSVIAMERFGLPSEQNGFMLSYIGCISLVMQGVGIVVCSKFFTDKSAMNGSVVVLTITYYLMTLLTDLVAFLVLLLPLTCALCLVGSILTAAVTKSVPSDQTGAMLGLNMAVHSVIRTAAPTVGGHIVETLGFDAIGYLGVACNILALVLLRKTSLDKATKDEGKEKVT